MKYRRLRQEELQNLEEDFVLFLASQQILAQDWEKMKSEEPQKVEELIGIFSDIVLEKVLSKIEYLQHRQGQTLRVFYCQEEKIAMTALQVDDPEIDFNKPEHLQALQTGGLGQRQVQLYHIEKVYSQERNLEVLNMLEIQGCRQASAAMYEQLTAMYKKH